MKAFFIINITSNIMNKTSTEKILKQLFIVQTIFMIFKQKPRVVCMWNEMIIKI